MAATNFKTENNTFRKLIGNGLTYRIPRFQRDYSWTLTEWEDLWLDIMDTLDEGKDAAHYMGYLVLQSGDDKAFSVIDGQQRLTTMSLLVLAVLKNIQALIDNDDGPEANKKRLDQIRQTYIGYLDPVTLISSTKLTLNRNNDSYYQDYLVPLGHLPQRGFRASEHQLRKAFEWFEKKVAERLKTQSGDKGKHLAQLVEDISDKLFFTIITVTDELNAYKVFETLNARGVRLSSTDLLKNYLFSVLDRGGETEHELRRLEERWEMLVTRLQAEKFPAFLRVHWNSRHKFARQAELFKSIRSQIRDNGAVFELLRGMEEDLDAYLALTSPEASDWPAKDKQWAGVLKTFRVRQPFALLLAARRAFDDRDFTKLLHAAVVISMRYNVISARSTGEQESTYSAVAGQIARGEITELQQGLEAMRGVYVEDRAFRAAFAEKAIRTTDSRNNRVVRFILCALENKLSGNELDFESDAFNIEHVLPQNAPDGWGGFDGGEASALTYRLGNMTLMQSRANRDAGNAEYAAKRDSYRASTFAITQRLAEENAEWTPERIAARQNWMAKQAEAIWRIAQLS